MTLAKRIIPCLDVDHSRVVKGIHFRGLRDAGDPVALARRYSDEGADELIFLDITASPEKRNILSEMVRRVAFQLDIPFTVGGGIRSVEDARLVLCSGADKVSVNTAVVEEPALITKLAKRFGRQCVVVAIDAKMRRDGGEWYEVYTYGGRRATGIDALVWARRAEELGAGELLVTSMDRDGTVKGYDLKLTRAISEGVNIPVIASGGCGELRHFLEAFTTGRADGALAASVFHYERYGVQEVKQFLAKRGVVIRL